MGSGSNFDELTIDANGRVSPSGPLTLDANENMEALYAWVIQANDDGTGAVCAASEEAPRFRSRTRWTTRDDALHLGRFRPGPAIGLAVQVSRVAGASEPRVYWWSESLQLPAGRGAGIGGLQGVGAGDVAGLLEEALRILRAGGGRARGQPGAGVWAPGGGAAVGIANVLEEIARALRGG
jgi:hypothetical protein